MTALEKFLRRIGKHPAIAFQSPCFHARECANPKYHWDQGFGDRVHSCGLTLNIGLE